MKNTRLVTPFPYVPRLQNFEKLVNGDLYSSLKFVRGGGSRAGPHNYMVMVMAV
jgi:hypothetical protein